MLNGEPDVVVFYVEMFMEVFQLILSMWPRIHIIHVSEPMFGEHKQAVKRGDLNNDIAVHAHESHHAIDWDGAAVKRSFTGYWQRRTTEVIHMRNSRGDLNLDSGQQLPTV